MKTKNKTKNIIRNFEKKGNQCYTTDDKSIITIMKIDKDKKENINIWKITLVTKFKVIGAEVILCENGIDFEKSFVLDMYCDVIFNILENNVKGDVE